MTDKEIQEGNVLISNFMGDVTGDPAEWVTTDKRFVDKLKYHSSWKWLMPVVEKIEGLGYFVSINGNDCLITDERRSLIAHTQRFETKIQTVLKAVTSFIEWHEDRRLEDMPEYVKESESIENDSIIYVYKVKEHFTHGGGCCLCDGNINYCYLQPATKKEYEDYLSQSKTKEVSK